MNDTVTKKMMAALLLADQHMPSEMRDIFDTSTLVENRNPAGEIDSISFVLEPTPGQTKLANEYSASCIDGVSIYDLAEGFIHFVTQIQLAQVLVTAASEVL